MIAIADILAPNGSLPNNTSHHSNKPCASNGKKAGRGSLFRVPARPPVFQVIQSTCAYRSRTLPFSPEVGPADRADVDHVLEILPGLVRRLRKQAITRSSARESAQCGIVYAPGAK